ncbi:MAG: hypothetical protein RLZZ535_1812 [Cyanobacteriota bacterium]|jgi:hypothetical protein
MDSKEIDSRLAEIDVFQDYLKSRIEHSENGIQYAQKKKNIENYKAKQEQCRTVLDYLDERKSMLIQLKTMNKD